MDSSFKKTFISIFIVTVILSSAAGGVMGFWAGSLTTGNSPLNTLSAAIVGGNSNAQAETNTGAATGGSAPQGTIVKVDEESAVVDAVQKVSPAVVSIIITKDLPVVERYYTSPNSGSDFFNQFFGNGSNQIPQYRQNGTQQEEIGGGTGFIVSPDGYIITNRHVVSDATAQYTVLMNDQSKHDAKVIARDPVNDIAILKIDGNNYPTVELGDSSNLKAGQTVIAIGNALGEFSNTVSTGVISGLSRSVIAGDAGMGSEQLSGVIQTDASINPGNSGGPLLNLAGQVIGMNTAIVQGAQNIGFAIPVAEVSSVYNNVKTNGRLVRPWLGVRYVMVDPSIAQDNNLSVDYGALIVSGQDPTTEPAVIADSPAAKAGLAENDIILEVNGTKIDSGHTLANLIANDKPGDKITLKVLSNGSQKDVTVTLEEMPQQ